MNSDVFIFLDDVQYSRGGFFNRNVIKCQNGKMWLTVPVYKGNLIKDAKIDNNQKWNKKHLKSIKTNYSKSPYYKDYIDIFEEFYSKQWSNLSQLDIEITKKLFDILGIKIKTYISSELDVHEKDPNLRLIKLCKKIKATTYLSGIGGKNYLNEDLFNNNKIKLEYQNFKHPVYLQLYDDFIENMSIIDIILNHEKKSLKIIEESNNEHISNCSSS